MKTVTEVARITGVSVRTLHHYDAIGLLRPTAVTEAGYRLYDDNTLGRLQTILLFRQLQFPLKEIRKILDSPNFDPQEALAQQIELLELQKEHLEGLIAHARQIQKTGVIHMDFSVYDQRKIDEYSARAKEKWGGTDAYQEYEQKTAGQSKADARSAAEGLMDIFQELGRIRTASPASDEAQSLVKKLQDYITAHYYTCTSQILRGLGQMYAAGGEMTENIDKAGGDGTAVFAKNAIEIYCK